MKLGVQVGLGPGRIVLDGDPAHPPQRGRAPQFSAHVCCNQMAGWIKMPLGIEVGLGPGHIVLDRDPSPLPKRGGAQPPQFSAHVYCGHMAVCIRIPLGTEVGLSLGNSVRWGPSSPSPEGAQLPNFRPMSVVAKRLDGLRCHLLRT